MMDWTLRLFKEGGRPFSQHPTRFRSSKLRCSPSHCAVFREEKTPSPPIVAVAVVQRAMDLFSINKSLAEIEKLNGSNYGTWKRNMDIVLGCMDYDFVLSKSKPIVPSEGATDAQTSSLEKWKKTDKLTKMIIRASIDDALSGGILDTDTAAELMKTIKEQFMGSKKSLQISYLTQIMTTRYDGNGNVRKHILKLSKLVIGLRDSGIRFDDELLIHVAIISLPKAFDAFKINYNTQESKWDLNQLIKQCVTEEERMREGRKESAHLSISRSSKKIFKPKGGKKKPTWNMKKSQENKGGNQQKNQDSNQKKGVDCWFCQKSDHFKKQCNRYKKWLEKNPTGTQQQEKTQTGG